MDLKGIALREISQAQKNKYYMIPLNKESKIAKLVETKGRMVVARGKGTGDINQTLKFQLYKVNKT